MNSRRRADTFSSALSFTLFVINFLLILSSIGSVSKSPGCICTWMSKWCLITTSDALPLWKRGETHDTKQISQIKLWQNGSGHALVFLRRHCLDGQGPFIFCSLERDWRSLGAPARQIMEEKSTEIQQNSLRFMLKTGKKLLPMG